MNILDNHITDIDNRIKDICETAPKSDASSIQESLSSYGWILLDSWIAWRTLRFLIKDQDLKIEIQRKWFQTPSSFSASQIRAVWQFGSNVDCFLGEQAEHNLKYIIDEEIEKMRNSSAHFSTGGIIRGSDYQKISFYHKLFSNIFLLYEIFSFFISISLNCINSDESSLKMYNSNGTTLFEHSITKQSIDYNLPIINLDSVSTIRMEFRQKEILKYLNFDKDGCYFDDKSKDIIEKFNIFSNKGYYRDVSLIREKLNQVF